MIHTMNSELKNSKVSALILTFANNLREGLRETYQSVCSRLASSEPPAGDAY